VRPRTVCARGCDPAVRQKCLQKLLLLAKLPPMFGQYGMRAAVLLSIMALLSFGESTFRAQRLRAGNASFPISNVDRGFTERSAGASSDVSFDAITSLSGLKDRSAVSLFL
jgi:hypothetical protein